jgi:electron transport complex protein RnfE
MSDQVSCHGHGCAGDHGGRQSVSNGLWKQNPVFVMVLGMCPTLAITNSVRNAVSMGLATTFVMVVSYGLISMIRKLIPKQVRIATYIAILAMAVTVVDFLVKAISIPIYWRWALTSR